MNDQFLKWLKTICESHPDALQSLGWEKVTRCEECTMRYTSCPMVVRSGGIFAFFTKDDDYCSYGVVKGESDGDE